jgi:hypothetical protein
LVVILHGPNKKNIIQDSNSNEGTIGPKYVHEDVTMLVYIWNGNLPIGVIANGKY